MAKKIRQIRVVAKKAQRAKYPIRIETTVSPTLRKRIENCADAESMSVATYVRRLLDNHVPGGI